MLVVLHPTGQRKRKSVVWLCQCDCGERALISSKHLANGQQSCGCLLSSMRTTHGHSRRGKVTPTYKSWAKMIERCCNAASNDYPDYGGRGISVHESWRSSFQAFLSDMGECPAGMSIDRIDTNGNYEPGNCRWTTALIQGNNKRNNVMIAHNGVTKTVTQWARITGLNAATIRWRHKHGWPEQDIFNEAFPGGHGAR